MLSVYTRADPNGRWGHAPLVTGLTGWLRWRRAAEQMAARPADQALRV